MVPRLWLAVRYALLIAVVSLLSASVTAQTWPARPVRVIVPFPPGGGLDGVVRILTPKLTEQLGTTFVVENRPGGSGALGAQLAAKAAPDGYTLFTSAPEFSINPSVRLKLPYDTFKDFAFVSQLTAGQFMLVSHPSVPVRTVKQLIALAKARPRDLNYGHSGVGGINHLAGELFQSMAGIRWEHVPFKGAGPAIIGIMGGEIDFIFASTTGLAAPAKAGRVRAIAVTGPKRFMELPEVPTIAESGVPGYNVTGWYGLYAPAGTSAEIVRLLHTEVMRALNNPEAKDRLRKTGNEPVGSSPEEFLEFVRVEVTKWAKVVKEAKVPTR